MPTCCWTQKGRRRRETLALYFFVNCRLFFGFSPFSPVLPISHIFHMVQWTKGTFLARSACPSFQIPTHSMAKQLHPFPTDRAEAGLVRGLLCSHTFCSKKWRRHRSRAAETRLTWTAGSWRHMQRLQPADCTPTHCCYSYKNSAQLGSYRWSSSSPPPRPHKFLAGVRRCCTQWRAPLFAMQCPLVAALFTDHTDWQCKTDHRDRTV
jgi:hypothetical protein